MASSTANVWKPAQGVQLAPIKMAKTAPVAVTTETTVVEVKSGYRPPQARPKKEEPLDFGETSFPTLGGPSVIKAKPESKGPNFKDKILNLIAKDQMDEEERLRLPENDPFKMLPSQLAAEGYAMLQIPKTEEEKSKFVRKFIERMNRFEEVPLPLDTESY
jgi:hypothetical protein